MNENGDENGLRVRIGDSAMTRTQQNVRRGVLTTLACCLRLVVVVAVSVVIVKQAEADDWRSFRGNNRDGKSSEEGVPLEWDTQKNIKWKVKLPCGGNSSPISVGQRVLVNCAEDEKGHGRSLYCFDADSGKQLWVQTVRYDQIEGTHSGNPYCASTPASDGKLVVVWHGSAGVYCYDLEGREVWKTDMGPFRHKHNWGYASSPLIHGEMVYLNCGPEPQFVVGIRVKDGKIVWKTDESGNGSWGSPVLANVDGQVQLVVFQAGRVNGYDVANGKVLWTCETGGTLVYTDVIVGEKVAVAMSGRMGPAIGFSPGGSGNVTATRRLWVTKESPQRISNGVLIGEHLYVANEPGLIECVEAATGKKLWEHKLAGERFWSAIISTPGRLYVTSQTGTTFVFAADPKEWKLLATNRLGEYVNGTPAISGGRIFVRTWKNLWCVEKR